MKNLFKLFIFKEHKFIADWQITGNQKRQYFSEGNVSVMLMIGRKPHTQSHLKLSG